MSISISFWPQTSSYSEVREAQAGVISVSSSFCCHTKAFFENIGTATRLQGEQMLNPRGYSHYIYTEVQIWLGGQIS